ncbi:hypothetical protein CesoFtcFv8_016427 [Champsocephalus esox]|uniref:Uncharacterized protein n=1 Tax=Champsocephalus esox TaxID=159716 RepID=A0AAN8BN92_9TELE|nr:hypothetical protein CesoFtcFv8_016427 [Champsocephalus esox]
MHFKPPIRLNPRSTSASLSRVIILFVSLNAKVMCQLGSRPIVRPCCESAGLTDTEPVIQPGRRPFAVPPAAFAPRPCARQNVTGSFRRLISMSRAGEKQRANRKRGGGTLRGVTASTTTPLTTNNPLASKSWPEQTPALDSARIRGIKEEVAQ